MARKRRKQRKVDTRPINDNVLPTVEQLRSGDFDRDFVMHAESATKAMTYRNRETTMVQRWMREEEKALKDRDMQYCDCLWPEHARRFIGDCLLLWQRAGNPRLTAAYGERIPGASGDGMGQKEAIDKLHRFREMLGTYQRHYWTVFENVLRNNEPAGVAGSKFAKNAPQRQQSAKLITSMVAIQLATRLGY